MPAEGTQTMGAGAKPLAAAPVAGNARLIMWSVLAAVFACLLQISARALDWQERDLVYLGDFCQALVLITVLVTLALRRRRAEDARESRFWGLLWAALFTWLLVIPASVAAGLYWPGLYAYATNLPYLLFFYFMIAALRAHPHVVHDPVTYPLRLLEWSGSMVLLLGMLTYFLAAPAIYSGHAAVLRHSSLVIWLALDTYLIVWLWFLRSVADQRMWRLTYGWLLCAVVSWSLGDLVLLLEKEGLISLPDYTWPLNLLWLAAFCALARSTALREYAIEEVSVPAPIKPPLGMGPLVLYASLPLLLHTLLYRFGSPEPELGPLREGIALAATVLLTGLTLTYQRLFSQENQRLAEEETQARAELAHRAFHDQLTGLPNRNLYQDRLQVAIATAARQHRRCAVLFCDLDQFKVINDSLGHEAGDETLMTTARRLRDVVRQQDTVARLGGDEFAVLLTGIHESRDAALIAQKLLAAISEPMDVGGKSHVLTASIGVAVFPDDGENEEALLKHADTAMYQSKIHGRNTYRLFTEAMNVAAQERLVIEQGLRTGLVEDQFALFYQPIVNLGTGHLMGCEALLRWRDPRRGYVSPASFINVAEQTGLIVPIGRWVLEAACAWASGQRRVHGELPCVSVNMSPRQLREPDVVSHVSRVLEDTGLAPDRLQLEITESAVLAVDACRKAMVDLQALGLRIAIDDFGTGYSALSRLRDMPVDTIKIDRSFVQRIEENSVSEAIVHAVVGMAEAMEVTVVAEGVETEFEMEVVRKAGCHAAQGYHLCKPLSEPELAAALEAIAIRGRFDSRSSGSPAVEGGANGLVPGIS